MLSSKDSSPEFIINIYVIYNCPQYFSITHFTPVSSSPIVNRLCHLTYENRPAQSKEKSRPHWDGFPPFSFLFLGAGLLLQAQAPGIGNGHRRRGQASGQGRRHRPQRGQQQGRPRGDHSHPG